MFSSTTHVTVEGSGVRASVESEDGLCLTFTELFFLVVCSNPEYI